MYISIECVLCTGNIWSVFCEMRFIILTMERAALNMIYEISLYNDQWDILPIFVKLYTIVYIKFELITNGYKHLWDT